MQYNCPVKSWDDLWGMLNDPSSYDGQWGYTLDLTDELKQAIVDYHQYLVKTNEQLNLTRLTSLPDFGYYHLLDTYILLQYTLMQIDTLGIGEQRGLSYADIGTGCGVPGLLFAWMHAHMQRLGDSIPASLSQVTLVDSMKKRCDFLESIVTGQSLVQMPSQSQKVQVIHEKADKYLLSPGINDQILTARALMKLPALIDLIEMYAKHSSKPFVFFVQTTVPLVEVNDIVALAERQSKTPDKLLDDLLEKKKLRCQPSYYYQLGGKDRYVTAITNASDI